MVEKTRRGGTGTLGEKIKKRVNKRREITEDRLYYRSASHAETRRFKSSVLGEKTKQKAIED